MVEIGARRRGAIGVGVTDGAVFCRFVGLSASKELSRVVCGIAASILIVLPG